MRFAWQMIGSQDVSLAKVRGLTAVNKLNAYTTPPHRAPDLIDLCNG
jgi:hypothetical protein